jgi:histidine triad (HIT) family protein
MSIFTKIVAGEIPSYKIAETAEFYAFLDINPNAAGHTLCIPKEETDKLLDLPQQTYAGLMEFSRKVGLALRESVKCKRVGMSVIGLEVPHVHVHMIPINQMDDMRFSKKMKLTDEEMKALAERISKRYREMFAS